MNERCEEIEVQKRRNDYFALHKAIKEVVNRKSNTCAFLEDINGTVVITKDLKIHWKSYIRQLFKSVEPL